MLTRYAPGLRHPYPIYESIADLVLFALLIRLSRRLEFDGGLFAIYLAGYGTIRFVLEFFRDNYSFVLGLSQAQWVSVLLIGSGLACFAYLKHKAGIKNRTLS